jgi:hypothetical protein
MNLILKKDIHQERKFEGFEKYLKKNSWKTSN